MRRASGEINAVVQPVVEGLGYDFVGAEFGLAENGQTLRVYIDKPAGIVIDDCAAVSRQLSAVLDVEDAIPTAYQLEVSSPGIDRPLFTEAQFAAAVGSDIRLRLRTGVQGRRNFRGRLQAVDAGSATLLVDGNDYTVALSDVEGAHCVGVLQDAR